MKLAMWSGPRNLSTAMMYAFAARADFAAWDEPFYAPYLAKTGLAHPMRDEILAAHAPDHHAVSKACGGPPPGGAAHWYQKHMCHHMLDRFDLSFAESCVNVFLIRHPARVIASYHKKHENPSQQDVGCLAQLALFEQMKDRLGIAPIVIDSADIRRAPEAMLRRLCDAINLPFDLAMLSWPAGPKPYDGIWAAHWYGAAHRSTGFAGAEGPLPELPKNLHELLNESLPAYRALETLKL